MHRARRGRPDRIDEASRPNTTSAAVRRSTAPASSSCLQRDDVLLAAEHPVEHRRRCLGRAAAFGDRSCRERVGLARPRRIGRAQRRRSFGTDPCVTLPGADDDEVRSRRVRAVWSRTTRTARRRVAVANSRQLGEIVASLAQRRATYRSTGAGRARSRRRGHALGGAASRSRRPPRRRRRGPHRGRRSASGRRWDRRRACCPRDAAGDTRASRSS